MIDFCDFFCHGFHCRGDKTAPNTAEVADEEAGPGHSENRETVISSKTGYGSSSAVGGEGSESKSKEKSWDSDERRF